jgi:hypothetical protein
MRHALVRPADDPGLRDKLEDLLNQGFAEITESILFDVADRCQSERLRGSNRDFRNRELVGWEN